jgi:hypothetical protein
VPALVLVFALTAAFGPLSAVQLSIRSQANRVARLLDEAGAGRTVAPDPAPARFEVAPERYDELRDALGLLATLGDEPGVRRVLTGSVSACSSETAVTCLEHLGVYQRGSEATPATSDAVTLHHAYDRFSTATGEIDRVELVRRAVDPFLPLASTDGTDGAGGADVVDVGGGGTLRLTPDRVVLDVGGTVMAQADLAALISQRDGDRLPALAPAIPLVRPDGSVLAELAVEQIDVYRSRQEAAPQVVRVSGIVLWRQWPEQRSGAASP